jgi:hypothetical protein
VSRPTVDAGAVAGGAVIGVATGAVAAVGARVVDALTDGGSPLTVPLLLVTLAGLITAGWTAAHRCLRAPLTNAAVAALAAVAVLLVANLVWRLAAGEDVRWAYLAVWAPLALACGLVGGLGALRAPLRRADSGS